MVREQSLSPNRTHWTIRITGVNSANSLYPSRSENGYPRVRNGIPFEGGSSGLKFIRARPRRSDNSDRSTSAFFLRRDGQRGRPSVRYAEAQERRARSTGPGEHDLSFPAGISGTDGVNRIEYRYRWSGHPQSEWRQARISSSSRFSERCETWLTFYD
jgi:hypothetical protein